MTKKKNKTKEYLVTEQKTNWYFLWLIALGIAMIIVGSIGFYQTVNNDIYDHEETSLSIKEGMGMANFCCFLIIVIGGVISFISVFLLVFITKDHNKIVTMEEINDN